MKEIEVLIRRIEDIEKCLSTVKEILTFKEVCTLLGFSEKHLYRLCYQKLIPCHNPTGRTLFFLKSEIIKWIKSKNVSRKQIKPLK